MPCLNPITIPTRSRFLISTNRDALFNTFRCNNCVTCENLKIREYQYRSFYESEFTFKSGGFLYFDALTYREDDVPHVSDLFPIKPDFDCYCFNHDHLRKFLVNLHRQLDYHGFDVKGNLSHFICCEYGTSDSGTHRPHYHVLFFVRFKIEPITFSFFISKCWKYGHTDGVGWKSNSYILNHNTLRSNSLRLTNYVCKYIQKSSLYSQIIDHRISYLSNSTFRFEFDKYSDYKSELRRIKRSLSERLFVSHFFGISALEHIDLNSVIYSNMVQLNTPDFVLSIPLPLYYVRHLFYRRAFFNGFVHYIPTSSGELYEYNRKKSVYSSVYNNFYAQCVTLGFTPKTDFLQRFTNYFLFYRHRLRNDDFDDYSFNERMTYSDLYLYQYPKDFDFFGGYVVSRKRLFNPITDSYSHFSELSSFRDLLSCSYTYEPFERFYKFLSRGYYLHFKNKEALKARRQSIAMQYS